MTNKHKKHISAIEEAENIGMKAADAGFDWHNCEPVFDKIEEEIEELRHAIKASDKNQIKEEFGDVLFSCINLARKLNINAEQALKEANIKFLTRFLWVQKYCEKNDIQMKATSLDELNTIWSQAKLVINDKDRGI